MGWARARRARRDDLSSTGYALANPAEEYLVLQPSDKRGPFTVMLEWGTYSLEWFSIESRETVQGDETTVESPRRTTFSAPSEISGPTALYLKKVGH